MVFILTLRIIYYVTVETLNNGSSVLLSPPHNNGGTSGTGSSIGGNKRDSMQVTQPTSPLESPLPSPISVHSASFSLPSSSNINLGLHCSSGSSCTGGIDTADPNWQATKSTVRERNAAMFNNDLMSDVQFIVGIESELAKL